MFTRYSLVWMAAAGISLLYLILLATQPDSVARFLGSGTNTAQNEATQKALGETVAEVRTLRDTIDLFRNELIEIRAQVSNQSDATRELASRIGTLETAATEPQKVADAQAAKLKEKEAAKKAAKEAAAKEAAAKKAKRDIETGSVAQPAAGAITFGPAIVTPAATPPASAGQVGVQIATGPSTLLNERHGASFRSLEPRYTTNMSGPDQTYDLVVGPVASVDEAKRLCQELALKATPCTVSRFTGDAL
ncbi:MAG: hypothetical protein J0H65_10440 [Rhizobiales bacterium]|nr:hypothetical protein [Hyphomicrobiales bacterium]